MAKGCKCPACNPINQPNFEYVAPRKLTPKERLHKQRMENHAASDRVEEYIKSNDARYAEHRASILAERKNKKQDLLSGIYVWVETTETGHAFVSIFENGEHTLYSYGRYDDIYNSLTGEGILFRFTGENASGYLKMNLYKFNAQAYLITDAKISNVKQIFDDLLNQSTEKPNGPRATEAVKQNGKVVDKYDLTGNNCTTYTVNTLKKAGSRVFNTDWLGIVKYTEDFMIPASLMRFLDDKCTSFDMEVIKMTNRFKASLNNSKSESLADKRISLNQSVGTAGKGIGYVGQSSGYSGGTSGGSF